MNDTVENVIMLFLGLLGIGVIGFLFFMPFVKPTGSDSKSVNNISNPMKKRISHISVHQTSKVITLLYVVIGLFFIPPGVLIILGGQTAIGIVYVLMPFIYAILGYPLVAVTCWIYNMIAKGVGGIEFTLEDK